MTGISELDRVLGGGIVIGSVTLIGGEPRASAKSTILLQLCGEVSKTKNVLYVTGEESVRQIKARAVRLNVPEDNISLVAESDVDGSADRIDEAAIWSSSIRSSRCAARIFRRRPARSVRSGELGALFKCSKNAGDSNLHRRPCQQGFGAIAGPKVMRSILWIPCFTLRGDKTLPYRVLRAVKNRYGSTNEIGMFDMTGRGLAQIENPSQVMLEGAAHRHQRHLRGLRHGRHAPGAERNSGAGDETSFPSPRRTASGFDYNRMYLLLAVLEKRAGCLLQSGCLHQHHRRPEAG